MITPILLLPYKTSDYLLTAADQAAYLNEALATEDPQLWALAFQNLREVDQQWETLSSQSHDMQAFLADEALQELHDRRTEEIDGDLL